MLKLENSIRGLSFSRVAFDLTIQGINFATRINRFPEFILRHYDSPFLLL